MKWSACSARLPDIDRSHILYTPNFAPREEYAWGFEQGVRVTVDNTYVVEKWPEVFRGREIFVRIDTGTGRGHHHHVRTGGAHSKFGVPVAELDELRAPCEQGRGARRRPACAQRQRRLRRRATGSRPATLLAGLRRAIPRRARRRCGRRPGRARARRSARRGSCEARRGAGRPCKAAHPQHRAVDRAGPLLRGRGRRAARARDAAQGESGRALRGHRPLA